MLLIMCAFANPVQAQEPRLEWTEARLRAPMLTLGLKPADALFPVAFAQSRRPGLTARPAFPEWIGNWKLKTTSSDSTTSSEAVSFLPPTPIKLSKAADDTAAPGPGVLSGKLGNYADIGMMVRGRGELGGAWNRYSPCDPGLQLTCNPGLFPQLRPDVQFGVLVGGTISNRVHVNVDYDQTREFDAANNIHVYYQGFEDEVLQRLEVGDVSIRLPSSRYMTQGIPAGNFGFKAAGQMGPVDFQTVFAQQRGDVTTRQFRLGGGANTQGLVQDETLAIDDAAYVKGQFFFLLDPDSIAGAPHVDVLALRAIDAKASLRPATGSIIEVYRDERPSAANQAQQAQIGYFLADAVMPDNSRKHTGLFKRLEQDKDYVLHPSGLWIMLRAPLRQDEALAVSYVTERGDTMGTVHAEASPPGTVPKLRLIRGPASIHQPNFTTWDYELHNVYRVHSSSTVDPNTIALQISLGQLSAGRTFVNSASGQLPYLRLFGLDEDAPVNALDVAQVYQPPATSKISGTFVILPTLRPFFEPAPVPSARLTAADAKQLLGNDANGAIYNDLDPIQRDGAARFRLNFQYRVKLEGLVSSFSLGAFGMREESERITIGDRVLVRGQDYNIDYDIGMVTLTDAQSLFATNINGEIHATWEQKSQFQIAPTSIFGLNAHYGMGPRGELNFVGLYQAEKTIMSRPELGIEPSAIFLGGTSGRLDLGGKLLDRVLSGLPGLRFGGASALTLSGEAAFSLPNPNTRNQAYVEDFEAADGTTLDLRRRSWHLGSRAETTDGTRGYLPAVLNVANAAQLVWQHDIQQNGQITGGALPGEIDTKIQVVGTQVREPTMWLTLGDPRKPKSAQRWRSITSVLSTTALDLSRSEYLEFYVWSSGAKGQALVFDIGSVSEDAFYFDAAGRTAGNRTDDGSPWGLGQLDAEARLAQREIWDTQKDARGLYDESCTGSGLNAPALGDPAANCARKNGLVDTEDLDGNGILDENDGPYFRYTVPLDAISQYLVRDRSQTGTLYQLYRIPLRDGLPVNGANSSTWRFIKHLRMTVVSAGSQTNGVDQFVMARLRIIGSRWIKRDVDGVSRGLLSDQKGLSSATAIVKVSPVSRLTNGAEYSSPPLVREQVQDPSHAIGATGEEFNEKGLSVQYSGLGGKERAEIYYRYPQQPRSFLNYRELQLWAVAKKGNFGANGDQRLIVKVGADSRNYYLYQTRLKPSVGDAAVQPSDWDPQIAIDFNKWFDLKARAEVALIKGGLKNAPGQPYVLFDSDSTYGIVFEDRARAPNLAAVRELSFGIYNGNTSSASGEVWLNDIRLNTAFRDAGVAGNITLDLRGGDFLGANITYANQGALFRQLNQDASYVGNGDLTLSTTAQLGQLLPASWGLEVPLTVAHTRTAQDPTLLEASDVQARRLDGLRRSGASATRVGMLLHKRTPSANRIISALLDPLRLQIGYNTGDNSNITLRNEASGFDGRLSYSREVLARDVDILPGFIEAALKFLMPSAVENSAFFKRVTDARFRYTPLRLSFNTVYFGQERRAFQYTTILATDSDALIVPLESPRRTLDSDVTFNLQPFNSLTADLSLRTARDLLPGRRATAQPLERSAIEAARGSLAGLDMGWETSRSLNSQVNFRPQVSDWIKPAVTLSTRFGTDRSPSYLEIVTVGADSTAILQRRFQADRQLRRSLELQPTHFLRALSHDTASFLGRFARMARAVQPVVFTWNQALGSQFDRKTLDPNLRYQFALGSLNSFRILGVDSAASATENGSFDASTALNFLRSAQLEVQYTRAELQAYDQRGGSRLETERTWPNIRLNWSDVTLPHFVKSLIPQLGVTASYQIKRRDQALGGQGIDRGGRETIVPFSARVSMPGGIATTYTGAWSKGSSKDPTGDAHQGGLSHNVNVSVTIKPPESMAQKLKQPVRISLGLTQNAQNQCRYKTFGGDLNSSDCAPFIDFRNRALNLTLDTNISDMVVGLQMGYTDRQDFVGTRRGNSQFQLGVFANFELPVGQLPPGAMGGIR